MSTNGVKMSKLSDLPPKRKTDYSLWRKAKALSAGTEEDKKRAIEIISKSYFSLPRHVDRLLKELCGVSQPVTIRQEVAKMLDETPDIPSGLCLDLLGILIKDDNEIVKSRLERIKERHQALMKPILESTRLMQESISKAILEPIRSMQESILKSAVDPTRLMQQSLVKAAVQVNEALQLHVKAIRIPNIMQFVTPEYFRFIESLGRFNTQNTTFLASLVPSFYPLSTLEKCERKVEAKVLAHPLVKRLDALPTGKKHWSEYQDVCEEILSFCFVPPLLEPQREAIALGGLHRRDLIYHIPHDVDGFWHYVKTAYSSLAVIIECKNYSRSIAPNQIAIGSKYFGPKKLGTFGVLVSRKGPSKMAQKQQMDLWTNEDKMILCISDQELKEMVALKSRKSKPEIVLDRQIRKLRQSI